MSYTKSEKLLNLLENKTVALVGPSEYLVGRHLGGVINEYDVVCRLNYMATPTKLEEDYGNRTDIMFYNCAKASLKQMEQHLEEFPEYTKKLKLVACPPIKVLGPEKWEEWGSGFVPPTVECFKSINKYELDFYWNTVDNYRALFDMMKCKEPNTGTLAMLMILKHNPKSLFLTGCTFYAHKYNSYFEGYATQATNWSGNCGHPQSDQLKFFKDYVLKQNIKIDSYLNDLLKLNYNNIHEL